MGYRSFKKKSIPAEAIDGDLRVANNSTRNTSNIPSDDDIVEWSDIDGTGRVAGDVPYWNVTGWAFGQVVALAHYLEHIITKATDSVLGHVRKGDGVTIDASGYLSVKPDNVSVDIVGDLVGVKTGGITEGKLGAGAVTTTKISNGTVTLEKLEHGPDGQVSIPISYGAEYSHYKVAPEEGVQWEQSNGAGLSGPPNTWVELDFDEHVLGGTDQIDRSGSVWKYAPETPGQFHINFWFRLDGKPTSPPNAWTTADIEIGYRINSVDFEGVVTQGPWVQLDQRPFTTSQDGVTLTGARLVFLTLIDFESATGNSKLIFGYRSRNTLPMIFPSWQGVVDVRRHGQF